MLPKKWRRPIISIIAKPVLKGMLHTLWLTCRVKQIIGDEQANALISDDITMIPCYWHQDLMFGIYYMLQLRKRGLKVGFLISPSRDGEVPAQIVESWGLTAIRGSSNRTGARALRDLYQLISKERISPVNTSDGPTGPIHKFKPGAIMLAQMTGAPILPVTYAANRYWQLKSWDKFIIPKPFSTIAIAVGEPRYIGKELALDELAPIQQELEQTLSNLRQQAETIVAK